MTSTIQIFNLKDFEEPIYPNLIGIGSFGSVYRLKSLKNNDVFAVKILFIQEDEDFIERFFSDIHICILLSHPTLLKIHGISVSIPYCIFTDYIPNRSVRYFIEKEYQGMLEDGWNMTHKFIIILGTCLGILYLHSQSVAHFDLKPENILLESNFYPKISDFNYIYDSRNHNNHQVPLWSFCAPEVLMSEAIDKRKADVFSFGMLLYSIIYGRMPFSEIPYHINIANAIARGERPELNDVDEFKLFNQIISRCWDMNPESRPNFSEIKDVLIIDVKNQLTASKIIDEKEVNDFLSYCNA